MSKLVKFHVQEERLWPRFLRWLRLSWPNRLIGRLLYPFRASTGLGFRGSWKTEAPDYGADVVHGRRIFDMPTRRLPEHPKKGQNK